MPFIVAVAGRPKKATEKSVQYSSVKGGFYVRKDDLKAGGFSKAPGTLYHIITDTLPDGVELTEAEAVEFEL